MEEEENARYRWIAEHILPYEREVRNWLRQNVHRLPAEEISDIIQEAYASLWLADFQQISDGRAYLYALVQNLVTPGTRRAHIAPAEHGPGIELGGSWDPAPETHVTAQQEIDHLLQVISSLHPPCSRAFELHKLEGLSVRDIARKMKITDEKVEKHLSKALARILSTCTRNENG